MLDVGAPVACLAEGVAVEARIDRGQGPLATVVVRQGTLRIGDAVVVGATFGRVRSLASPSGEDVEEALPGAYAHTALPSDARPVPGCHSALDAALVAPLVAPS